MYCFSYVIKKGDTLYKISRQFNVGIGAIMDANPLIDVYNLMVGTPLCIPVSMPTNQSRSYATYLVQDGDTLGGLLKNYNVSLADFMENNNIQDIHLQPGSSLNVPATENAEM